MMAQWMWKFGEFEVYHNLLVHNRRQQYGYPEPPVWKLYAPESVVRFKKTVTTEGGTFRIHACGNTATTVGTAFPDIRKYGGQKEITLAPGTTEITITVSNPDTFPCLLIEGVIESGEGWMADDCSGNFTPAGTNAQYREKETTPERFLFAYEPISCTGRRQVKGGWLFDFGKETFARTRIKGLPEGEAVRVNFGESVEEALDDTWSVIHFLVPADGGRPDQARVCGQTPGDVSRLWQRTQDGAVLVAPGAFRYIWIGPAEREPSAGAEGSTGPAEQEPSAGAEGSTGPAEQDVREPSAGAEGCTWREAPEILAEYEYLPLARRGSFSCTEEIVQRVWDVAAYTFHLNCREFFLDGIKRDRWVWSADAYQSLFVNRYLFFDPEIEKRTLIALGGKQPFVMHINTIADYSFFWIISIHEYYKTYGDIKFLSQIWPQMKAVMDFCIARTDDDGFLRGRDGDWIFIDWAPMDKTGAVCGEQILYAKAMECYAKIAALTGQPDGGCGAAAKALQDQIFVHFYDKEKGVFIDSFESGKRNVTRHSNILAYLFLPCGPDLSRQLYERVVLNDDVPQITTPYFKFYENQVHCMEGNGTLLETSIREYYGSMLAAGATSLYEEYDPTCSGTAHYAMYGNPYEKSLCHAWSASPVYLLGAYRLGVKNTGIAYDTFEVCPNPGDLSEFSGVVPLPGGEVRVTVTEKEIRAVATVPGGTFRYGEISVPMEPGKERKAARAGKQTAAG